MKAVLILGYGEMFIQDHAPMSKRRRYKPQSTQQVRTISSTSGTVVSKPPAARPPHHPRASRSAGLTKKLKCVIMTINSRRTNLLKGCAAASHVISNTATNYLRCVRGTVCVAKICSDPCRRLLNVPRKYCSQFQI
jgi:hypothetical protein